MNRSALSVILTVIGVLAAQTYAEPHTEAFVPFEYGFDGIKYKFEGGRKFQFGEIKEKWSSKMNTRYLEYRYPSISGDNTMVTEYIDIIAGRNEMDYSYNQETKTGDCDLSIAYNSKTSNQTISDLKEGLAANYIGL